MRKRTIMIGIIALVLFVTPLLVSVQAVEYGDITCTEKFIPVHKFECRRPDLSIEKVFQTYEQMSNWYSPPRTETFIPEVTYVYGAATETYTLSGN